MDKPKDSLSTLIKVQGAFDVHISDNKSNVPMQLIDATDVRNVTATGNQLGADSLPQTRAWYETWWGLILIGLAISIAGGGALYFFGWI